MEQFAGCADWSKGVAKRQTAAKNLEALQEIGLLTGEMVGRERIFVNTALLELLKDGRP